MSINDDVGVIFSIQRFSVDDGPGIRTTVFLKGCDICCRWCHNPESIDPHPVLSFVMDLCVGCGTCARICPTVHVRLDGAHTVDRQWCAACGKCAENCPAGALAVVGERMTVDEVMRVVEKDSRYFRDEGGVTFSGGEPMAQLPFLEAMLAKAKANDIRTALETNGNAGRDAYMRILPLVDLFLWDIKETDPERHRLYTGVGNKRIVGNLYALGEAGGRFVLRCPLIPGLNDRQDHIDGIRRLAEAVPGVVAVQIMPYHNLGRGKAARFGLPEGKEFSIPDGSLVERWTQALRARRKESV
jgi:pyruvate formate lyase activating enzyme